MIECPNCGDKGDIADLFETLCPVCGCYKK
jgi:ribosomal protein L32